MKVPVVPVGFVVLAGLALAGTLVVGAIWFAWWALSRAASAAWRAWGPR